MKSSVLISKKGQPYRVTIPEPKSDLVSAYIFAFVKSGSTLLNNMVEAYCQYIDVPTFSIFSSAFDQGIQTHEIQDDASVFFKESGYVYTGFRHLPSFNLNLTGAPVIWLTRDPRDMLISRYYSVTKSHVIPKGMLSLQQHREAVRRTDINHYVIDTAKSFDSIFQRYKKVLTCSNLTTYRYEDVIYEKEKWLTDVVAKLGLQHNPELVDNIASHFDIVPETENENEHIRQVHPGDHRKKLTPKTIQELNNLLSDFLKYFDYER